MAQSRSNNNIAPVINVNFGGKIATDDDNKASFALSPDTGPQARKDSQLALMQATYQRLK